LETLVVPGFRDGQSMNPIARILLRELLLNCLAAAETLGIFLASGEKRARPW